MRDIVDAFGWLRTQMTRYMRNELIWTDIRDVLHEASALEQVYRSHHPSDDFGRFGNVLRSMAQASGLADCTDDYLRHRLRDSTAQGDRIGSAYLNFLLWQREQRDA